MDSEGVYRILIKMFPQVDSRILKKAAIEHPNDVNRAVQVIAAEVFPFPAQFVGIYKPSRRSGGRAENEQAKNMTRTLPSSSESKSIANVETSQFPGSIIEELASLMRSQNPYDNVQCQNSRVTSTETEVPASSLRKREDISITTSLLQGNGEQQNEWKNSVVEETLNAATSRGNKTLKSNQDINFLQDIVEEAKKYTETVVLAMESMMNMMGKVEFEEKIAEQVKEEAATAGLDILEKLEEFKQILERAKNANDMIHAEEVCGAKAVLSIEVRELQARLIRLSDARDKALASLEEMDQSLKVRLAAAKNLRRTAEKQKLEKEESAQHALAKQTDTMEKVVQDFKLLQEECEKNTKLHDFLMDRGQIIDKIQGEISVIFQDISLRKERFDEDVQLSKSNTSSETSSVLVSPGSSVKSVSSDVLFPKQRSHKNRSLASEIQHEDDRTDPKELLEDGWEIMEKDDL